MCMRSRGNSRGRCHSHTGSFTATGQNHSKPTPRRCLADLRDTRNTTIRAREAEHENATRGLLRDSESCSFKSGLTLTTFEEASHITATEITQ